MAKKKKTKRAIGAKGKHSAPREADSKKVDKQIKAEDAALEKIDPETLFEPQLVKSPAETSPVLPPKKSHRMLFVSIFFVVVFTVSCLAAWQYGSTHQLRATQQRVDTEFKDIAIEYKTYQNDRFYGNVAYLLTNNPSINRDASLVADRAFAGCKNTQVADSALRQCMVSIKIYVATADFLQLEYTVVESTNSSVDFMQKNGLLYNRKTGKRIEINNLFKPGSAFLDELSKLSGEALKTRFAKEYAQDKQLKQAIDAAIQPQLEHFKNFLLPGKEQLTMTFNLPSKAAGPMQVNLSPDKLYGLFEPIILQTFFPQLKEKKETERRLAEEAKRKAEEAEAARKRTRHLVAPNRSNIDCAKMKCVALTYDDGPAGYTAQLLDILQARQAVATFFVLGSRVSAHANLLRQAVNQQNEIANHSWNHPNLTRLDNAAIDWQVDQTSQAIFNATGSYPKLFRPPEGAFDARVITQVGMPLALWSIDTNDWRDRSAEIVYQHVVNGVWPGAVVLMHDIHTPAIEAAPRVIDELQRQGYILVTMSELFGVNKDNLDQFTGQVLRRR